MGKKNEEWVIKIAEAESSETTIRQWCKENGMQKGTGRIQQLFRLLILRAAHRSFLMRLQCAQYMRPAEAQSE